jgi:hypothetical protein
MVRNWEAPDSYKFIYTGLGWTPALRQIAVATPAVWGEGFATRMGACCYFGRVCERGL